MIDGLWIVQYLPAKLVGVLPAFVMIGLGLLTEKTRVGKLALFTNAVSVATYFYFFHNLPMLIIIYVNLLSVVGLIAIITYFTKTELPKVFYRNTKIFSTFASGIVLLYGMFFL